MAKLWLQKVKVPTVLPYVFVPSIQLVLLFYYNLQQSVNLEVIHGRTLLMILTCATDLWISKLANGQAG